MTYSIVSNRQCYIFSRHRQKTVIDQNHKSTFQSRSLENLDSNTRSSNATLNLMREKFGSQYLYYDDEEDGASGIDVMGPTSVMMSRANDGW